MLVTKGLYRRSLKLLIWLSFRSRVQQRHGGDKGMESSPVDSRKDDVVGKVFIVVGPDMRQCLICDRVFTRECAAEHAGSGECDPLHKTSTGWNGGRKWQIEKAY